MTEQTTRVWESLKTVNGIVDVFETCIDFGLTITATKKIAEKWQSQKKLGVVF